MATITDILVCPESHQKLHEAPDSLIAELNKLVAAKELKNRSGHVIKDVMESGLVREDRKLFYPVRDGIPVMLLDEAVVLEALNLNAS